MKKVQVCIDRLKDTVKWNRYSILLILVIILVGTPACVKDNWEAKDVPGSKADPIKKQVESSNTTLSEEAKQEQLEELEALEAKLLEKSREVEEKIKELQQKGD